MVPTPKDEAEAEAILEDIFPGTEDTEEPDIDEPVNEDPAPEDDLRGYVRPHLHGRP